MTFEQPENDSSFQKFVADEYISKNKRGKYINTGALRQFDIVVPKSILSSFFKGTLVSYCSFSFTQQRELRTMLDLCLLQKMICLRDS